MAEFVITDVSVIIKVHNIQFSMLKCYSYY